jgi:hypothetical protein
MSDNKHMPTLELLHLAKVLGAPDQEGEPMVLEDGVLDQENSPKQR